MGLLRWSAEPPTSPSPCGSSAVEAAPRTPLRRPSLATRLFASIGLLLLLLLVGPSAPSSCNAELVNPSPASQRETFREHLLLRPLPDGRLQSSFDFTLTSTSSSTDHFRLLPRSLLQVVQSYDVDEVHLSLNTGRWEYSKWGSPSRAVRRAKSDGRPDRDGHSADPGQNDAWLHVGDQAVAPGAELWAKMRYHPGQGQQRESQGAHHRPPPSPFAPEDSVYQKWRGLTSSLAGLFCASLDALDERSTVMPNLAFGADAAIRHSANATLSIPASGTPTSRVLHAFLASESVCTENLTPLLKLLPCKGHAGLASLLNPLALFAANFQGLAVHVVRRPAGGWEVKLSVQAVFSPAVTRDVSNRDWSLQSLFQRTLTSTCPVADASTIRVLVPDDQGFVSNYELDPLPPRPASTAGSAAGVGDDDKRWAELISDPDAETWAEVSDEERLEHTLQSTEAWRAHQHRRGEYVYDTTSLSAFPEGRLDIRMAWPTEQRYRYPSAISPPTIEATRQLSGSGQQRTTLRLTLRNNHLWQPRHVLYFDVLPWFLRPLLHTLRPTVLADPYDGDLADRYVRFTDDVFGDPIQRIEYQPSLPRRRAFPLELHVRIPPLATVHVELQLDKAFVRYAEHPPDAHRGFDLAPAVVFLLPPSSYLDDEISPASPVPLATEAAHAGPTRIYTLPNLVELATPDFSFVYTNIIFTSTVVALFFGSTLNGMVRTFRDVLL